MEPKKNNRIDHFPAAVGLFVVISIFVCIILFYVDEGRYSLKGILQLSNLLGLGIYFIICLGIQLLLHWLLNRRVRYGLSILASVTGLVFFILIFFWLVSHFTMWLIAPGIAFGLSLLLT